MSFALLRTSARVPSTVVVAALVLGGLASAEPAEKSRYWEWGWGLYGASAPLDVARYDWSLINFGNVPADERTVERCNEIRSLNPKHKFVVRVWPIMGKGDCPENRHQATVFHYLYKPGVREKVLEETRRQLRLVIEGVSEPSSVVGATFLEELPGHFTSSPFRRWKKGDPPPWDVKRFEKEIAAELGAPFDLALEEHRLWWGRKYCEVLGEIHQAMKEASDGRLVIYWQATGWYLLDHLAEGQDVLTPGIVPISYKDVLKPGVCDGIFGYPNNELVWRRQTQAMAEKHNCLFFSQTSSPAGMRLSKFDEMTSLARWEHVGNLGTFFFLSGTRGTKAWNELPWLDGTRFWTVTDLARKVGWDHQIGMDVVERNLRPQVQLDYDATGKRKGDFVHVYAQVVNPRDASWYGGDADGAALKDVRVNLTTPRGFAIPLENSAPPTVALGDIAGRGCKVADWWVRVDGDGSIAADQRLRATVGAGDGPIAEATSSEQSRQISALQEHPLTRSGDTWIEPAYQLPDFAPAAEIVPQRELVFPELRSGEHGVVYRDVLAADMRLTIGPGHKAALRAKPLLTEEVRTFAKYAGDDGLATFTDGYGVAATPRLSVRPAANYRFELTGKVSDGGIVHAIVFFAGKKDGEPIKKDVSCFYNQLGEQMKTVEKTVESPEADLGTLTAIIRVYRHKSVGTLHLQSMDFALADIPEGGLDVSDKLEGVLPKLERPFTQWVYRDRSDPDPYDRPKLTVRFFKP